MTLNTAETEAKTPNYDKKKKKCSASSRFLLVDWHSSPGYVWVPVAK